MQKNAHLFYIVNVLWKWVSWWCKYEFWCITAYTRVWLLCMCKHIYRTQHPSQTVPLPHLVTTQTHLQLLQRRQWLKGIGLDRAYSIVRQMELFELLEALERALRHRLNAVAVEAESCDRVEALKCSLCVLDRPRYLIVVQFTVTAKVVFYYDNLPDLKTII